MKMERKDKKERQWIQLILHLINWSSGGEMKERGKEFIKEILQTLCNFRTEK